MPDLRCYCMTSWCQLSYNYTLEDRSLSYRGDHRSPSPPPASLHEAKKKKKARFEHTVVTQARNTEASANIGIVA